MGFLHRIGTRVLTPTMASRWYSVGKTQCEIRGAEVPPHGSEELSAVALETGQAEGIPLSFEFADTPTTPQRLPPSQLLLQSPPGISANVASSRGVKRRLEEEEELPSAI